MVRGRREERRAGRRDFGRGSTAELYQLHQRLLSIGHDFWIENDRGERVYKGDGMAQAQRQTLLFEDAAGNALYTIQEPLALGEQALITPPREHRAVSVADGPDLEVQCNLIDHEYAIGEGRDKTAEVSAK